VRLPPSREPLWLATIIAVAAGCSASHPVAQCTPSAAGADTGDFASSVSAYCMLSMSNDAVEARSGVTPYDLNTPLFSDYAVKYRTVWLPKGTHVSYVDDSRFEFPVGTVITKSFGFPADFRVANAAVGWIETRVLVRGSNEWKATSYVWDEAHTDARISVGGEILNRSFIDASGQMQTPSYLVPSQSECKKCHANDGAMITLGPSAAQLNRDDQYAGATENELARWSRLGLLVGAPSPDQAPRLPAFDDPSTGDLPSRARAYLHANCAYCHNGAGEARTSGLVLLSSETDPYALGVCKGPVAAGKAAANQHYDIVPAHPEQSILVYRMQATMPSLAMPELGRSLEHTEAVQVVSDWIAQMSGSCM
jgi:uncharacterized repeat protein (TIGR03806 family)